MCIQSPLRDCGISKYTLRKCSKHAELFTWNKPAYACLATRVQQGERLQPTVLQYVESVEAALHAMGFSDFRVRVTNKQAKLQVTEQQFAKVYENRERMTKLVKQYFTELVLDLTPRESEREYE